MMASKPRPLEALLNELYSPNSSSPEQKKLYNDTKAILDATNKLQVRAKEETNDAKRKEIKVLIAENLGIASRNLSKMLDWSQIGTFDNPLEIEWPKPETNQYPKLLIGPRARPKKNIKQNDLAKAKKESKSDGTSKTPYKNKIRKLSGDFAAEWEKNGEKIIEFHPETARRKQLPFTNHKIGITTKWQVRKDKKFKMIGHGQSGGGDKLNRILKKYGFYGRKEMPNYDADHVWERQLGGEDALQNLWPLKSSQNQASGRKIKYYKFKVGTLEIPLYVVKKRAKRSTPVWIKIKSTENP